MKAKRGKELPRFLKYSLCENIVKELLEDYKQPCFDCLQSIDSMAEQVFLFLVDKTFEQFVDLNSEFKVILIF